MFKITNISRSALRYQDKGRDYGIEPGQSIMVCNPPDESYLFHVEEIKEVNVIYKEMLTKDKIIRIIENYVTGKKVLTNKEWKDIDIKYAMDGESREIYDSLESYTLSRKVLSNLEFEKIKNEKRKE
jgi:hypothetical protein